MTIEEMRAAKSEAEESIRQVLNRLREQTGLCPTRVHINYQDKSTISSKRVEYFVANVSIDMESI